MLLGIVGAVVAGYIGQAMGLYTEGEPAGFVMSLLGAIALLFVYRLAHASARLPDNRSTRRRGRLLDPGAVTRS